MENLDQGAVRLAKSIRKVESNGNFEAKGASGENGAYQFMPATWKEWSTKYLGEENAPLTRQNQNKVAYSKIKELKDEGYRPSQIASIWNSGGAEWEGKVGTNKFGVKYDVPSYVGKVKNAYASFGESLSESQEKPAFKTLAESVEKPEKRSLGQKLTNTAKFIGNETLGIGDPANIQEAQGPVSQVARDIFSSTLGQRGIGGVLQAPGKAVAQVGALKEQENLAETSMLNDDSNFRIAQEAKIAKEAGNTQEAERLTQLLRDSQAQSNNLRGISENLGDRFVDTPMETLGKTGNALGTLASFGIGGAGVKGTQGLLKVAGQEAAIGAGFGVTDQLARGESVTLESVLQGGVGGFVGGAVGVQFGRMLTGAARRFAPNLMKQVAPDLSANVEKQAFKTIKSNVDAAFRATKSTKDVFDRVSKNTDVSDVVSRYALIPDQDIKSGRVNTDNVMTKIGRAITDISNEQISYARKLSDQTTSIEKFKLGVSKMVKSKSTILNRGKVDKVTKQVNQMLDGYKSSYGNNLTPEQQFVIRKQMNADSKSFKKNGDFVGEDASKIVADLMRKELDGLGDNVITESLKEVGDLIGTRQVFEKLSGQTLGSGKLMQMMYRGLGAFLANTVSSESNLMIGPLIGALGGDVVIQGLRRRAFGPKVYRKIMEQMAKTPDVVTKLRQQGVQADNLKWLRQQMAKPNVLMLKAAPEGSKAVKSKIVKSPAQLAARSQSTIDAQEIARIQGQIKPTIKAN